MTNLEVIKAFAEKRPDLLAELLDDIYCIGFNTGARAQGWPSLENFEETLPALDESWLNSEYDNNLFRESDVQEIFNK